MTLTDPIRIETVPTVVGLTTDMYVEYFGVVDGDTEFIIYRPRDNWEYTDFRCLMKPAGMPCFIPCEIKAVTRYRDGGTTNIDIQAGRFHFPSLFASGESATFADRPITVYERH